VGGAVFALSADDDRNEYDVLAVPVFALVMGLGGGIIRDILLNRVPAALTRESYLLTAIGAGLAAMLLAHPLKRIPASLENALDSAVLGLFVVVGTIKAEDSGLGAVATILLGTITGVGGGVFRDLLAQRPVQLMQRTSPYVAVAALGASLFVAVSEAGASQPVSASIAFAAIVLVRLVAFTRGWRTPAAQAPAARVGALAPPGQPWRYAARRDQVAGREREPDGRHEQDQVEEFGEARGGVARRDRGDPAEPQRSDREDEEATEKQQ
jgi:uncharacterized membrane protein YeiH